MYTQPKPNACRIYINNQQIKSDLQHYGSMGIWMHPKQFFAKLIRVCLLFCLFVSYFAYLLGFVCLSIILRLHGCDEPKNENRIADLKNRKRFFLSTKSKLKFDLEI